MISKLKVKKKFIKLVDKFKQCEEIESISIYINSNTVSIKEETLRRRCEYFIQRKPIIRRVSSKFNFYLQYLFNRDLILIGDCNLIVSGLTSCYNVDYETNPSEAWVWHVILQKFNCINKDIVDAKKIFLEFYKKNSNFKNGFLLGTGPSLNNAQDLIKTEGIIVACNTIVKDVELCVNLKINIIVAGDALYHFGENRFAAAFRRDLKKLLDKLPSLIFIYPSNFHPFVRREFSEYRNRLVPIPISKKNTDFNSLIELFELPNLGNVLNLLLLPVGVTFVKNIYLIGFDGRNPSDRYFWSNSNRHFYSDEFEELLANNKAFFKFHVPEENPNRYVENVHGDLLNQRLSNLERNGYKVVSLNESFTKTINDRYLKI